MNYNVRFRAIGRNATLEAIYERHQKGEIATCPKCGEDLVLAFSWRDCRNDPHGHPGVFCPIDGEHFYILVD